MTGVFLWLGGVLLVATLLIVGSVVAAPGRELEPKPPRTLDLEGRPEPDLLVARDGVSLAVRRLLPDGPPRGVVVLIHGSGVDSRVMHPLASALRDDGFAAYAPDVRGHGGSGRRGDITYLGQLDDDLDDLVAHLDVTYPGVERTLVGFSGGGAFVLRVAGSAGRAGSDDRFDRYLLLSPALTFPSKVARRDAGGWAALRLPRIVGILAVHRLGIHRFDGLEVIRFAVHPDEPWMVGQYSFRLAMNFGCRHHRQAMARVRRPIALIAGAADEQFHSDRYAGEFQGVRPDLPVQLVDELGHVDLVLHERGIAAIRASLAAGCRSGRGA